MSLTRLLKRVTEGKRRVRTSVNRLLRKIFQSNKQNVTLGRKKFQTYECDHLCYSPDIVRVIGLWSMRWKVYVAHRADQETRSG
jgi:hypothetical protein